MNKRLPESAKRPVSPERCKDAETPELILRASWGN